MRVLALLLLIATAAAAPPATEPAASEPPSFPRIAITAAAISPAQLFAEISKSTGVALRPHAPNLWNNIGTQTVSADIDGPFWLAVHQACKLTHVNVYSAQSPQIELTGGNDSGVWGDDPFVATDLAVVVLHHFREHRRRLYAKPAPEPRALNVLLNVYVDPRVSAGLATKRIRITEARDEAGNNFPFLEGTSSMQSAWCAQLTASMNMPDRHAARLALLRGEATFVIATNLQRWTMNDITKAVDQQQQICGFAVTLKSFKRNEGGYEPTFRAERGIRSVDDFAAFKSAFDGLIQAIDLRDAAGGKYSFNQWGGSSGKDAFEATITFRPDEGTAGAPATFNWLVPTQTGELHVPFEFRDLRLP